MGLIKPIYRRPAAGAVAICLLVFATLAATLTASEFTSSVESLVVTTAMEARRDGHWLHPTLDGELRLRKPPLVPWTVATFISPVTIAQLDSADVATRAAAFDRLTWQVRLPSAIAASLSMLALFGLARVLSDDDRFALTATVIAGTSVILLFHCRQALLDCQLLLWTTVANLASAKLTFRPPRLRWAIIAGAAMGLGMLAKGPVALLMTLIPFALFAGWRRWTLRGVRHERDPELRRSPAFMFVAALLVGGTIGLGWFAWTGLTHPEAWKLWMMDVTRTDPSENGTSRWYSYARLPGVLFPWSVFFILGLLAAAGGTRVRAHDIERRDTDRRERFALLLLMLLVPLIVMSAVRDRKTRYLLPLVIPSAMIAAHGVEAAANRTSDGGQRAWTTAHWLIVVAAAVALVFAAAVGNVPELRTIDGGPILSRGAATTSAVIITIIVIAVAAWALRSPWRTVGATAVLMAVGFVAGMTLYRKTGDAHSGMRAIAEKVRRELGDDTVVYRLNDFDGRKQPTPELSIYLNRPRPMANNPRTAPRGPRPQVIIAMVRDNGTPPPPPTRGWQEFGRFPRGKGTWFVYSRGPGRAADLAAP